MTQPLCNIISVVQLLVPPNGSINRDFLRDVLSGKKRLLKVDSAKYINVPKYDEISVRNIFPKFKGDPKVMVYLQDEYPKDRYPDRQYFFTVLNTVHPDYVSKIIAHANEQRFSAQGEAN